MIEKFVFIDRDGVINKDPGGWTKYGYVSDWEEFEFLPGVEEALALLKNNGFKCVIISNQQGVGKGYYTEKILDNIDRKMREEIIRSGGDITASYYCVHLKEEDCSCRKPKGGMFIKAKEDLHINDLSNKFFIGDNETDIIAGKAAGLKTILVLTGKTTSKRAVSWEIKPDHICLNLIEAAKFIINLEDGI